MKRKTTETMESSGYHGLACSPPPPEPEIFYVIDDMHMDKSDCEGPNADDHCASVFPILDEIIPPAEPEIDDVHIDKPDCEGPNADDHCESVFPILDEILPPAEPEIDDVYIDNSDCEGPNADDHCESVFPIPDEIPDSKLEEFFLQMKSNYEPCYRATLDKAARTITFSQQPLKLMPGPALNKYGVLELNTFFVYFPEKQATKLKAAWPEVELTLNAYSLSCDLNLAKCCMQVSTTPSLEDPCMIEKARHLLELLSTSLVPPYMWN